MDSETPQLECSANENKIHAFDLNGYLIENNVNVIFPSNLEYTHLINISRQGIKITGKGK